MVVSNATRARSKKDKALMTDTSTTPKVQDASVSLWENHCSIGQCPPELEAYVTVDILKNFMTTTTDIILQQVTKQVKKTMEAMNSMRPLPTFDYVPTMGRELSHRYAYVVSVRQSDEVREIARLERNGRSHEGNHDRSMRGDK